MGAVEQRSDGSYAWQGTLLSRAACRPLSSAMILISLRNAIQSGRSWQGCGGSGSAILLTLGGNI